MKLMGHLESVSGKLDKLCDVWSSLGSAKKQDGAQGAGKGGKPMTAPTQPSKFQFPQPPLQPGQPPSNQVPSSLPYPIVPDYSAGYHAHSQFPGYPVRQPGMNILSTLKEIVSMIIIMSSPPLGMKHSPSGSERKTTSKLHGHVSL